jgi:predicted TIM-barrel fold metal-dependent hydrolase
MPAYIDAHVHVWTPDLAHYPLARGYKREDMMPRSFTPEERFRHCRPVGVTRINLIQMSFYGFDNRYMLDMMDLHKDAFAGTAVIDPFAKEPERTMAELAKRRVRAFRIHPQLSRQPPPRWLEPAGYARMFRAGAKHNQAMSCLIGL